MAQVIDYYRAIAGGGSTMYYYQTPENSSDAIRISAGTVINLVPDYQERMVGPFYRITAPNGWIHWYHVQEITPVYKTVLDPCTAPTSLSLNANTKVLTINGGGGGDLNAFTGFGVSYRERSINESTWGAWSADTVVTGRSVSVTANSGKVRQYRVRTLGAAGAEHYSGYTLCQDLLNGNTAAGTPVILLPLAGAATCAGLAAFTIDCPPEPDGDTMTLQRSLNGGAWTNVTAMPPQGGVVTDVLSMNGSSCTVKYRLMDAIGATGGEDTITIHSQPIAWPREISAGDVIANPQVSFAKDLLALHEKVNLLCTFYGQSEVDLPGAVGRFGDVQSQMTAMHRALDECLTTTGRAAYGFVAVAGFPTAENIRQLKQAISEI